MAKVSRRRFNHRVSTVDLLIGKVETTRIRRTEETSIQISVWEMIEDIERDRMERYIFELTEQEAAKLIADLRSKLDI